MSEPLVSIVTPTFPGRETDLIDRCVPSVAGLDWPGQIQHVIVSDRNGQLTKRQDWYRHRPFCAGLWYTFVQINESWRNPITEASTGSVPWYIGSLLAMGEFIGFLGDDDELKPDHVQRHVAAMRAAEATFSISAVDFYVGGQPWQVIGPGFELGTLDSDGIMCHRSALSVASWNANGNNAGDHQLVSDWRAAGLVGTFVDGPPTAIHHDGWAAGKSGRPDRLGA